MDETNKYVDINDTDVADFFKYEDDKKTIFIDKITTNQLSKKIFRLKYIATMSHSKNFREEFATMQITPDCAIENVQSYGHPDQDDMDFKVSHPS
jgi:hypothetical protein